MAAPRSKVPLSAPLMPQVVGVADEVHDVGVLEERLAGDAAPVEAEAADAVFFEEDDGLAELRRANGGDVAARAAADDRDIVVSHSLSLDYH